MREGRSDELTDEEGYSIVYDTIECVKRKGNCVACLDNEKSF